ncbi:MAG: hypothetical protein AMXMBFR84_26380 [Candidatus Hydrogenedentota bacterium]
MIITNKHNLPEPLYDVLSRGANRERHTHQIGVTDLIKPPLVRKLELAHWNEITEDASDRVWAVMGQSVHRILETGDDDSNVLQEKAFAVSIGGMQLRGRMDLLEPDGTLTDYKMTSVYGFQQGEHKDWERQLNVYAWLLEHHGETVNRLQVVVLLRDWSQSRVGTMPNYPESSVQVVPITLWHASDAEAYILERIQDHKQAFELDETVLPVCSPEERWEKPVTYAVKKVGGVRAMKGGGSFDTLAAAERFAAAQGCNAEIEQRGGECTRCLRFCSVRQWCPFGSKLVDDNVPNTRLDTESAA